MESPLTCKRPSSLLRDFERATTAVADVERHKTTSLCHIQQVFVFIRARPPIDEMNRPPALTAAGHESVTVIHSAADVASADAAAAAAVEWCIS